MFDQFLSGIREPDFEDSEAGGQAKPMMKTKTITKNYGTRLGKPTTKVLLKHPNFLVNFSR